ncbi:hypothetical protein GGR28_001510 [Lewinella aquimaris]|uniref:Glyoxalase-like domain-containing protein n=1 Tax=Neolewinella aquimaris TaxID=1835722 RepID=A0A840E4L0_9BACT|nr:VOC family protein [Neolewinella aquimaris]MBB4078893.1 hypothetical protein [Neolewinella aquimaris]
MLDHLVYCVPNLEEATARLASLGVLLTPGGRHPSRGTHNSLVRIGPRAYLELLAVDSTSSVPPPRWMGIDLLNTPTVSRWAVNAGATIETKARLMGGNTEVQPGERALPGGETLRWQLTDPGWAPAVSVIPFLIDWGGENAVHPTDFLPDRRISLRALRLFHPEPERVNPLLAALVPGYAAGYASEPKIELVLSGPAGELHL